MCLENITEWVPCLLLAAGIESPTTNSQATRSEVGVKTSGGSARRKKMNDCLCCVHLSFLLDGAPRRSTASADLTQLQPSACHVWSHKWGSLLGAGPAVCSAGNHISGGATCPSKNHQSLTRLHVLKDLPEGAGACYPKGHSAPEMAQHKQIEISDVERG